MSFLHYYLSIGITFYFMVALARIKSFKNSDIRAILRGLILGIFLWPVATIVLIADLKREL